MTQVQSQCKIATAGHAAATPAREGTARVLGLGCAVPPDVRSQSDIAQELAELWTLKGTSLDRWRRIIAGTAIEQRAGVFPPHQIMDLSTTERMRLYEQRAPALAAEAAIGALESCHVPPERITDLIVVSCTGFSAPGLDIALIGRLGLPRTIRRSIIGFMGCFGAITGLRAAGAACRADPNATALVVCCELCSLHVRPNRSINDQIAAALFGDGAAAAVIAGNAVDSPRSGLRPTVPCSARGEVGSLGCLTSGRSLLLPEGSDWMTWRITQSGFAMTLDRAVPNALQDTLPRFVAADDDPRPRTFVIHPGGAAILEAADDALDLAGNKGIGASWEVLRRCGNMSSATVLFVLNRLHEHSHLEKPAQLLAFGPGLTIESMGLV